MAGISVTSHQAIDYSVLDAFVKSRRSRREQVGCRDVGDSILLGLRRAAVPPARALDVTSISPIRPPTNVNQESQGETP